MRYDNTLKALTKAEEKFEATVRRILASAARSDADVSTKLVATLKPKKHWTQLPKNKARLRRQLRKMSAAKKAKA